MDPLSRFGKKQKRAPSKTMILRQKLYNTLKDQGQRVEWKTASVDQIQISIASYRGQLQLQRQQHRL